MLQKRHQVWTIYEISPLNSLKSVTLFIVQEGVGFEDVVQSVKGWLENNKYDRIKFVIKDSSALTAIFQSLPQDKEKKDGIREYRLELSGGVLFPGDVFIAIHNKEGA